MNLMLVAVGWIHCIFTGVEEDPVPPSTSKLTSERFNCGANDPDQFPKLV